MSLVLIPSSEKKVRADLFVAACFEKEGPARELRTLEPAAYEASQQAVSKGRFDGKPAQQLMTYNPDYTQAHEFFLVGMGPKKDYRKMCFRKAASEIVRKARAIKAKTVRIALETFVSGEVTLAEAAGIFAEMEKLALYEFDRYRTQGENGKKADIRFEAFLARKGSLASLDKKIAAHLAIAEGVIRARDLINEPGNVLHPQQLAKEAREMARKKKIHCEVFGKAELEKLKMNGILAVGQGSTVPPALIILEYGKAYQSKGTVCLVGKGVTFDTGGISIKPSKDMEKMKYDMSGAATVIGTLGVVADLGLKRHVVGLVPTAENSVAEDPQRPGDIITMYNGKTVEVINTDAEGRLILGDALSYSAKYKPKMLIDLATLTGMCLYTFADKAIGLMGNDENLVQKIIQAGEATGERCWQLPIWEDYREFIKGYHSDLLNVGGPYGGTITAAMFLKEFIPEKTAWAHLDIAGTAWSNSGRFDCAKGATGVGVRLLTELLSR